jgi:hypothetical protein
MLVFPFDAAASLQTRNGAMIMSCILFISDLYNDGQRGRKTSCDGSRRKKLEY